MRRRGCKIVPLCPTRPSVVFAAGTPPPAVRPIFTVGVIVVLSVPPMVFVAIVYRPLTESYTLSVQFLPFYFKDTGLRDPSPRLTPRSGSNKAEGPHWWHWLWACRCPGSPLSGQPTAARRPPERATSSLSALSLAVSRET